MTHHPCVDLLLARMEGSDSETEHDVIAYVLSGPGPLNANSPSLLAAGGRDDAGSEFSFPVTPPRPPPLPLASLADTL